MTHLNSSLKKFISQSPKAENGAGKLDLHHHPPANIADVCGNSWWGIIHGIATSIRDHGCSSCGEHAITLFEYAHDLVNVSLEKPTQNPHAVREWTPYALQLAKMPEYEFSEISQNQRRAAKCRFNQDTFVTNQGAVTKSLQDLKAAQREGDSEGFVNELNALCSTKQTRLKFSQEAEVKIKGSCKPQGCSLEATTGGKTVVKEPKIKVPITELTPEGIDRAVRTARSQLAEALGEPVSAAPAPTAKKKITPGTTKTFAVTDGQQIELDEILVPITWVDASNNPETGEINPLYPGFLQPRNRDRAANMVQVRKMAATLDPSRLIEDFRTLDRGSPVVVENAMMEGGSEKAVNYFVVSGNGRAMAIQLAEKLHPDVYQKYLDALGTTKANMLVRVIRATDSSRVRLREIAELGNVSAAIATSTIEQANIDSGKMKAEFVQRLEPLDDESASMEETVRAAKNRAWVNQFLTLVPETELASVVDSEGRLSETGVRRIVMAIAMWVFGFEDGNRIAEIAFETSNQDSRNIVQGTLRAVPRLATMIARLDGWVEEADGDQIAIAVAARDELNISPSIGKAILRYIDLKANGIKVSEYLAQITMEDMIERTELQDRLIEIFDDNKRSARRISEILQGYAVTVNEIESPNQAGMFDSPGDRVQPGTALTLLNAAVIQTEMLQPEMMFQNLRANARLDKILVGGRR
jgi:hypothetical protein